MISTDITSATIDHRVDRVRVLGTSAGAAACAAVATKADDRLTAELRAPFAGGDVWSRPAALDVYVPATVPATQGHLVWSPPT